MSGARSSQPEAARLPWRHRSGTHEWQAVGTHYVVVACRGAWRVRVVDKWLSTWVCRATTHRERARSFRSREAAMRAAEVDYAEVRGDSAELPMLGLRRIRGGADERFDERADAMRMLERIMSNGEKPVQPTNPAPPTCIHCGLSAPTEGIPMRDCKARSGEWCVYRGLDTPSGRVPPPDVFPDVIVEEAIERLERANRGGEHLPLGAVQIVLHDLKRLRMGQPSPIAFGALLALLAEARRLLTAKRPVLAADLQAWIDTLDTLDSELRTEHVTPKCDFHLGEEVCGLDLDHDGPCNVGFGGRHTANPSCAHEDPFVLDGQTAWCGDCGALYGMGSWRRAKPRTPHVSPKDGGTEK